VAETYLHSAIKEGKKHRDVFVAECQEDSKRFERPIRKVQVNNFATVNFS